MLKTNLISKEQAFPGRDTPMPVVNKHFVTQNPIKGPFPEHLETALFGMGCFWGVERKFWQKSGIFSTAAGYANGHTPNPTYDELCTGKTAHNEVVLVVFDPKIVTYQTLLEFFWQNHNPTQGMRQGNDTGTQYRSGIYTFDTKQEEQALLSKVHYQQRLSDSEAGKITTEIIPATEFYYAEDYHQAYLAKNPNGYCGVGGIGISYQNS